MQDSETFAHSWHILMKGSIVAAGRGRPIGGKARTSHGRGPARQISPGSIDPPQPVLESSEPATGHRPAGSAVERRRRALVGSLAAVFHDEDCDVVVGRLAPNECLDE